jgi:hypothetical protein
MAKEFRVRVFGKADCDKCKTLNQRLDKLLEKPEWALFEKEYYDVLTVDGLVAFAEAECVNPQQIPAMLVMGRNRITGAYEPIPDPSPGEKDPICGAARLYHVLGLQTDYTEAGRGLITPKMIAAVLSEALSTVASAGDDADVGACAATA